MALDKKIKILTALLFVFLTAILGYGTSLNPYASVLISLSLALSTQCYLQGASFGVLLSISVALATFIISFFSFKEKELIPGLAIFFGLYFLIASSIKPSVIKAEIPPSEPKV